MQDWENLRFLTKRDWEGKETLGLFKRLTEKPWLPPSLGVTELRTQQFAAHNKRVALVMFLAIVGVLFSLFIVAYHMRKDFATDWVAAPEPPLLWLNSLVLIIVSLAFEWSRAAVREEDIESARRRFYVAGALTLAFLAGQVIVWVQMLGMGYAMQANPANAFFYVITLVHGLHLLGGLIAWIRIAPKLNVDSDCGDVQLGVDLCSLYWHFLLLVWVAMLALFVSS